jgi:predicted ribosomally synthesized peptide with nif11-like leader
MTLEIIKKFYEKVRNDDDLQYKIMSAGAKSTDEAFEAVTKIANSNGFAFTKADLYSYAEQTIKQLSEDGELDEAELDAVAGGGAPEWIAMSVITLGANCGLSLLARHAANACPMDKINVNITWKE